MLLPIPRNARGPFSPTDELLGPCAVTRVVDGDTVDVACPTFSDRARLLRIDTPERGNPGYREATDVVRGLVEGEPVHLAFENPGVPDRGSYGRLLAYLYVGELNLNVEIVRLGWSPFWTKYGEGRLADESREAEREAREARRGLWAGLDPWESDRRKRPRSQRMPPGECIPPDQCCRICEEGQACGDSCIGNSYTCRRGRGCACDADEVCW
jgi:endonuclease YncB( thermonuclease family)